VRAAAAARAVTRQPTRAAVLVPLTSSLYVRGNLENVNNPMVEIGTGWAASARIALVAALTCRSYFAKKSTEECDAFFKRKCDMIGEQVTRWRLVVAIASACAIADARVCSWGG
jgi:hypothetical protein